MATAINVIDPTRHLQRLSAGTFTRSTGAAHLDFLVWLMKAKAQPATARQ